MASLVGRAALITGGSRGIGRAVALELARRGADVAVSFRRHGEEAREVARQAESYGVKAIAVKADVSSPDEAAHLVETAEKELGRIDILINNAGQGIAAPLLSTDNELWRRMIETDLSGVFYVSREAAPHMIARRWGRIINISSIAGVRATPGLGAYSAAKAGVIALTQTLAAELAPHNITANAVCPGVVETKMGLSLIELLRRVSPSYSGLSLEEAKSRWASKHTLLGRLVKPEEVAALVAFLASEEAGAITGQAFIIDAGQLLVGGKMLEEL
ncbi:MAG: SDR family oxidoreductase [Aigarchaeota archaeon]|nr:SDR family oxidoreductase [Candidatus Pelearchaeum maunauluense]